jgi:hypothetical protein
LKRDDKLRPFLETLEEVGDQVSDVFRVRTLEGELLRPHRAQRERLREGFVAPEKDQLNID